MINVNMIKISMVFLFLVLSNSSYAAVGNLTSEQLIEAKNQGMVIIDIRTPQEWNDIGVIPGSKKIMFFNEQRKPMVSEFLSEFQKLVTNKDQPFILVCRSGSRTGVVTQFLDAKVGYSKGAHLAKGIKSWIAEKRQVEK